MSLLPGADGGAAQSALQDENTYVTAVGAPSGAAQAGSAAQGCPEGYVPCDSRNVSSAVATGVVACLPGGWLELAAISAGSVSWADSLLYPEVATGEPDTQSAAGFLSIGGAGDVGFAGREVSGFDSGSACGGVGWTGRFSEIGACECPVGYGGAACDVPLTGESILEAGAGAD